MSYGDLSIDAPLKPTKGLEGGACNRRSCQAEPALYYNHGSESWYCVNCARDIGDDPVNKRDWELRYKDKLGHEMFETREQMDKRRLKELSIQAEIDRCIAEMKGRFPVDKPKSAGLQRLLKQAKRKA